MQIEAFSAYPEKYRPMVVKKEFCGSIDSWNDELVFAAFKKDTRELSGYIRVPVYERYAALMVQKSMPKHEKLQINAAMVAKLCEYFEEELKTGDFYICDGEKNILHETGFQNYLEKYFGFRKAYCNLKIKYRWWMALIVKVLYPFREKIYEKKDSGFWCKVAGVLRMEESSRSKKCDLSKSEERN